MTVHEDPNYFVLFKPKNSPYYYYYVYRYGKKVWRSTGEKTKIKARQAVLKRILNDNILNEKIVYKKFKDFANDFWNYDTCPYIQDKIKRGGHWAKKQSVTKTTQLNKYIMPYFGSLVLEEITAAKVRSWLLNLAEKSGMVNKTCNEVLTNLRLILDEAVVQGFISENEARKVKPLIKGESQRKGTFSVEEIKKLFKPGIWESELARVGCLISAYTGMRLGEIRALTVEQVHEDYIEINASWAEHEGRKCTKSGHSRIAPISKELFNIIKNIAPFKKGLIFTYDGIVPVGDSFFKRWLLKATEKIGIDMKERKISFHSFRYFMNTRLVAANLESEKVRSIIGHESAAMTSHYLLLTTQDMKDVREIQKNAIGI